MVKIRLKRCGRKQRAFYQIVAIDARSRREGRYLQKVGFYDPIKNKTYLNLDAISYFIKRGARFTQTTFDLIKRLTVLQYRKPPTKDTLSNFYKDTLSTFYIKNRNEFVIW